MAIRDEHGCQMTPGILTWTARTSVTRAYLGHPGYRALPFTRNWWMRLRALFEASEGSDWAARYFGGRSPGNNELPWEDE